MYCRIPRLITEKILKDILRNTTDKAKWNTRKFSSNPKEGKKRKETKIKENKQRNNKMLFCYRLKS